MGTIYYIVNRLVFSRGGYSYPIQRPQLSLIGVFDDEEKARAAMKENAIGFILSYGCGPQHFPEDADKWSMPFSKMTGREAGNTPMTLNSSIMKFQRTF